MRILLFLFLCHSTFGQTTNTEVLAKIKKQPIDDIISIRAEVTNTTEVYKSLHYKFSVFRTNASNQLIKNTQEDRFTLEGNEQKIVGTTAVGTADPDKIVILLLIYDDENIIAKDRIVFNEERPQKEKEENEQTYMNDGVELKGIVIEETKTKPGRDFYEFFYNSYARNNINGSKIVGVYEKLSFGRSTIIQVKIEDNVIHEFLGKPDLEYLEQMSNISIRKVFKYFNELKKQKENIFQY